MQDVQAVHANLDLAPDLLTSLMSRLTSGDPAITTGHVLVGALTLATAFWLTWTAHRDDLEEGLAT